MRIKAGLLVVAFATACAACATTGERPTEELATARASIELAEQNDAQKHSTKSIAAARDKLARAEALSTAGDDEQARRLAIEADVDARLAAAEALLAKNETAAAELREGLRTLEREIERDSAVQTREISQ